MRRERGSATRTGIQGKEINEEEEEDAASRRKECALSLLFFEWDFVSRPFFSGPCGACEDWEAAPAGGPPGGRCRGPLPGGAAAGPSHPCLFSLGQTQIGSLPLASAVGGLFP